jgi:hypothetical protein
MRAGLERIGRVGWPVVAGVLVGLAAGGLWTVLQPDRFRAEARVLLRGASVTRVMPAAEALAESSVLEQNVRQTLHLSQTPHVSAKAAGGGVLTVSVEAGSRERARQIDAEAAQVLTQLTASRFGAEGVRAAVLDPAHPAGRTSPTAKRNLLIAGLAGLAVGLAGAVALARRRPAASLPLAMGSIDPTVERRLRERVDAVTKRERALAKRAGELAGRDSRLGEGESQLEGRERKLAERESRLGEGESQLERRQRELAERESRLERRETELGERQSGLDRKEADLAAATIREPPPAPPAPEPEPAPAAPEPAPILREPAAWSARWTMEELERVASERRDAFPNRVEEWETYLFLLRDHASIDGALPRSFDPLIEDVFGDALDH